MLDPAVPVPASRPPAPPGPLPRLPRRLRRLAERVLVRIAPTEGQRVFALTVVVGAACGLLAVSFHLAIRGAEALFIGRALASSGSRFVALALSLPALGGLVAGLILAFLVPGARGSGIPQVKAAFALRDRRLHMRDAIGKFILASLQIGSGASLGREGPTVQICSTLASGLGRLARLRAENVRRLIPVGAAAGIAAAFNAPLAAVTFTVEELLGALDQTMLSGVVVAAAIAAALERSILGEHPVLEAGSSYGLAHVSSLASYALLGVAAAAASVTFTDSLLAVRARFRAARRVPAWVHPAIGGLLTGAVAVVARRLVGVDGVNGGGYEQLGLALGAHLGLRVLVALCILKIAATVLSYGSGGAGGIFAPTLFIGGMLGGAVGVLDRAVFDHTADTPGAFALVGMGAVFAGTIRAPITSVLIIFEMTGSYGLILPLMVSNMTSFALARRFRPVPIYDALLEQDGVHLPHRRILADIRVGEAMSTPAETLLESARFIEILDRIRDTTHGAFPVVDAAGRLRGLVTLEDMRPYLRDEDIAKVAVAADACRLDAPTAVEHESLEAALERMAAAGLDHLPVVASDAPLKVIGMLTRGDILAAAARLEEREQAGEGAAGNRP